MFGRNYVVVGTFTRKSNYLVDLLLSSTNDFLGARSQNRKLIRIITLADVWKNTAAKLLHPI